MANAINLSGLPVTNIDRSSKFYLEMLGGKLKLMKMMGTKLAFFVDTEGNNKAFHSPK